MKRRSIMLALCLTGLLLGCQNQSQSASVESIESTNTTVLETVVEEEQTEETSALVETEIAVETETVVEAETTVENSSEIQETEGEETTMMIQVQANGNSILFELNDSQAAQDLYNQLPLTVENEDFSNNEKTFYPPQKLNVSDAPHTDGSVGTLAYYEPWGDVVLFYGSYSPNSALYELGKVTEGSEFISEISGEMVIDKFQD